MIFKIYKVLLFIKLIPITPFIIIKEKIQVDKKLKFLLIFIFLFALLTCSTFYFASNPHPKYLNFLWINNGIDINIIKYIQSLILFIIAYGYIQFIRNIPPANSLIKFYKKMLINDKSQYTYIYFFEKKLFDEKYNNLQNYEELLYENEFWNNLEDNKNRKPLINKLHNNSPNVLKNIIYKQIIDIPNSKLANNLKLIDEYPEKNPLFIYALFNEKEFLENLLDKIEFIEIVKDSVDMYFKSLIFETEQFEKEPHNSAYKKIYPVEIIIFYYIHLIDIYWNKLIEINVKSQMEPIYLFITKNIIKQMPKLNNEQISTYRTQNYYLLSIQKILGNISYWINLITSKNKNDYNDALMLFVNNQYKILMSLTKAYNQNKVSKEWLKIEYIRYLRNIKKVIQFVEEDITISFDKLNEEILNDSLNEYIYRDFYGSFQNDITIQKILYGIREKHTTHCISNSK